MIVVPAHVGHWAADLLYVMPVLVIVVWISIRAIIDRRSARADEDRSPAPPG
jgi:hypothetical protein